MQSIKKFNFMIREDIYKDFETLVPSGKRSDFINEAIKKELLLLKRKKLTEQLLSVREKTPSLTTEEIVTTLNEYRRGN
ncbi:MAG: hypothetical protein ABRQ39_29545 [Candidatus Eremiobacterota bacterium]